MWFLPPRDVAPFLLLLLQTTTKALLVIHGEREREREREKEREREVKQKCMKLYKKIFLGRRLQSDDVTGIWSECLMLQNYRRRRLK